MSSDFKYNIKLTLGLFLLFFAFETVFRYFSSNLKLFLSLSEIMQLFLFFLLLSFIRKRILFVVIFFITLCYFVQVAHFNNFGFFGFPIEIILMFTHSNEMFGALKAVPHIVFVPLLTALFVFSLCFVLIQKSDKRIFSKKLTILFFFLLSFPIGQNLFGIVFEKDPNSFNIGARPKETRSILKNSIYTVEYFIVRTLPNYLLNRQLVESWNQEEFSKRKNNLDENMNVIFVLGESLTPQHMSLYGYDLKTTPFLDQLSLHKNFMKTYGISAGIYTDTTVPYLMNVARKPNAINYILQNKNNLFKLAKQNQFQTYFITTQSHTSFKYIRNYLGLNYIDQYVDPYSQGSEADTEYLDQFLVDELEKINLERGRNFVVLSMSGSHEPYNLKYTPEFNHWKTGSLINHYDNSVLYTDSIIKKIYDYLSTNNKKSILLFTSDHGQHLGKEIGYGKGNLAMQSDYEVPMFFYTRNDAYANRVKKYFDEKWLSHYDFARIISYFLGYETLENLNQKSRVFYVLGGELNGNSGYATITFKNGKLLSELFY